ncbi:MAG: hypothetical protein ACRD2E_11570, partial [Terriglobales bacterium]
LKGAPFERVASGPVEVLNRRPLPPRIQPEIGGGRRPPFRATRRLLEEPAFETRLRRLLGEPEPAGGVGIFGTPTGTAVPRTAPEEFGLSEFYAPRYQPEARTGSSFFKWKTKSAPKPPNVP